MNSSLRRRLNSPLVVMALVALSYLAFIVKHRIAFHGDFSSFIVAGATICDAKSVPSNLTVYPGDGYDGQYYYRLALNPFTTRYTEFGIKIGHPAYRQQRILLPFLAWLLSLGHAQAVPFCIVTINWLALCLIGWCGAAYAQNFGRHALWGLPLAFYPGFILSLGRSTPELVEIAFLLLSLWLLRTRKPAWATVALSFALLGKETALLVALGSLISLAWGRGKDRESDAPSLLYAVIPLCLGILWQCLLYLRWGAFPSVSGGGNLGFPFLGLVPFFLSTLSLDNGWHRLWATEIVLLTGFASCVLVTLWRQMADRTLGVIWLLYAAQAVCLTRLVWIEDMAYLRALSEFWVLGSLILFSAGRRTRVAVAVFTALLWLFLFRTRIPAL